MHNSGLDVLGTVQFTNKDGDVRYLTFAEGSMREDATIPVDILEPS
jgi:hypothetical protein